MSRDYHEKLADVIVNEITKAQNYKDCSRVIHELIAICNASKVAKGKSRLQCDLKKFMNLDKFYYAEDEIDIIMQNFSARIGKQFDFRTLTLYDNIENKLINSLQPVQDLWEIAKIIYALGCLYGEEKEEEKISEVVYSIKDNIQKRNATIVARVYFDKFEEIFDVFSLDTKI